MKVRKFFARTTREALHQVKSELGPDAVILSNRQVADGTEIMALPGDEIAALTRPVAEQKGVPPSCAMAPAEPVADSLAHNIISQIESLRGMLEGHLTGLAWGEMQRREPGRVRVLRDLLEAGFSPELARQMAGSAPANPEPEKSLSWVKAALARNLYTLNSESDLFDRGGVYALVGPTGVGKTTTTAKLAARCVVRHGADKLALLTTDGYRIGAHEQLRIYGKILGVAVHAVKDAEDLRLALAELRNKHMVLIDTVGMSQRDQMVAEQAAMLCDCGSEVKRLLLLNATSNGDTLEDVVRAYRGQGLSGCILTKTDEAANMGTALDVIIRHKLVLHYVANGQRVPEDLHLANRQYLLHRAFKAVRPDSPYALQEEEFPLMMAAGARDAFAVGDLAGGARLD